MSATSTELPTCPNVLLSIKPEHADAILDGEKLWEYRKGPPKRGPPMRLVLYASSPVKAAIGEVWSWTVKDAAPEILVGKTVESTPHSFSDVMDYFDGAERGYALRMDAYRRFDEPVQRDELVGMDLAPAQNFRYIGDVVADPEHEEPFRVRPR